jgi:alkanesulfonate monooxygenase SsuD/methylene tetrahydromethanopterin reductase-like flavin-dependent oxidoreductase (luciferase family)
MRYAINVPNFGDYADARFVADLARRAEQHGWDGFFVWDHINSAMGRGMPMGDPWVILTAVALATERIRIGTMVTPLPRRRPWKVARETTTLDHLSGGRLILGVGLGTPADAEFASFGEVPDIAERARKLDEGLEVLTGLWGGEPFSFVGEHY